MPIIPLEVRETATDDGTTRTAFVQSLDNVVRESVAGAFVPPAEFEVVSGIVR